MTFPPGRSVLAIARICVAVCLEGPFIYIEICRIYRPYHRVSNPQECPTKYLSRQHQVKELPPAILFPFSSFTVQNVENDF